MATVIHCQERLEFLGKNDKNRSGKSDKFRGNRYV